MFLEDIFYTCTLEQPSAESESRLSELMVCRYGGYDVETVKAGERVCVNVRGW